MQLIIVDKNIKINVLKYNNIYQIHIKTYTYNIIKTNFLDMDNEMLKSFYNYEASNAE